MTTDIFTIVCFKDFKLWLLQARSVARYFAPDSVAKIIVVINEPDIDRRCVIKDFIQRNLHAYGELSQKVAVFCADLLLDSEYPNISGWRSQQAIKILAHKACSVDNVLILDAKNWFIKRVAFNDFFDTDRRPKTLVRKRATTHPQHKWLLDSLRYLDLPAALADAPSPPTITPYPVTTRLLLSLEKEIIKRSGSVVEVFSSRNLAATEFYLIYACAELLFGGLHKYYALGLEPPITLFNRHPQIEHQAIALVEQSKNPKRHTFSVHHGRMGNMSLQLQDAVSSVLVGAALLRPDEVSYFLSESSPTTGRCNP
jgi:hypothetical protein